MKLFARRRDNHGGEDRAMFLTGKKGEQAPSPLPPWIRNPLEAFFTNLIVWVEKQ